MKVSAKHAIHPDAIAALATLDAVLLAIYPSKDYAYHLAIEGQVVATQGKHEDTAPVAWEPSEITAEVEKRRDMPSSETKPKD